MGKTFASCCMAIDEKVEFNGTEQTHKKTRVNLSVAVAEESYFVYNPASSCLSDANILWASSSSAAA